MGKKWNNPIRTQNTEMPRKKKSERKEFLGKLYRWSPNYQRISVLITKLVNFITFYIISDLAILWYDLFVTGTMTQLILNTYTLYQFNPKILNNSINVTFHIYKFYQFNSQTHSFKPKGRIEEMGNKWINPTRTQNTKIP